MSSGVYREEEFRVGRQAPGHWVITYNSSFGGKVVGFIHQGDDKYWQVNILTAIGRPLPLLDVPARTKRMAFVEFLEWLNA